MLRRSPSRITLTHEDVLVYDEARKRRMHQEAVARHNAFAAQNSTVGSPLTGMLNLPFFCARHDAVIVQRLMSDEFQAIRIVGLQHPLTSQITIQARRIKYRARRATVHMVGTLNKLVLRELA